MDSDTGDGENCNSNTFVYNNGGIPMLFCWA